MPSRKSDPKPVIAYAREAVLDATQLGMALGVSAATVERMDLPFFRAGNRVRYLYGQVLDVLAERATAMGAPALSVSSKQNRRTGS
jgi:hypothetical protein